MWFAKLKDGPVRTECLRIARMLIKDELKRKGIKAEQVEASQVTKAAHDLLACDYEANTLREAKNQIKARMRRKK